MPSLLTLPRELRDLIYREVFDGPTQHVPVRGRVKSLTAIAYMHQCDNSIDSRRQVGLMELPPQLATMPSAAPPSPPESDMDAVDPSIVVTSDAGAVEAARATQHNDSISPIAGDIDATHKSNVVECASVVASGFSADAAPAANTASASVPALSSEADPDEHTSISATTRSVGAPDPASGVVADTPGLTDDPADAPGEMTIRYSLAEAIPPTSALLRTCHQVRDEMQHLLARRPVHYRIRLAVRNDAELIYPTWLSLPTRASHIDLLTVELRVRPNKSASIFSTNSDITVSSYHEGDAVLGGMVLLRRFLERGPRVLARTPHPRTIDRLVLDVSVKSNYPRQDHYVFYDTVRTIDSLFFDPETEYHEEPCIRRRGVLLTFFAERVRVFECRLGKYSWEWHVPSLGEVVRSDWDPAVVERLFAKRVPSFREWQDANGLTPSESDTE